MFKFESITEMEVKAGLRALVSLVGHPNGTLPVHATQMVDALQELLGTEVVVSELSPITPAELAAEVTDPWVAEQIIRSLIVGAVIDFKKEKAHVQKIRAYAKALGVDEVGVKILNHWVRGQSLRFRYAMMTKNHIVTILKKHLKELGIFKVIGRVLGLSKDHELIARYQALRAYPEGTLGREFADFIDENSLSYPGTKESPFEAIALHDFSHVMGGFGTEAASEVQAVAFQSGHANAKSAFVYFLVGIFQFHLGFRFSPVAPAFTGQLDVRATLDALVRGVMMNTDMTTGGWDPWTVMDQPLEAVRSRYNVLPKDQVGARRHHAVSTLAAA